MNTSKPSGPLFYIEEDLTNTETTNEDSLELSFYKSLRIKSPSSSPKISRRSNLSQSMVNLPRGNESGPYPKKVTPSKKYPAFYASSSGNPAPRLSKSKKAGSCSSLPLEKNVKESQKTLPWFTQTNMPEFNCVSPTTVGGLLSGEFDAKIDKYFIVDCRFKYEYVGGHIRNAINMPNADDVKLWFIDNPLGKKVAIIFYCEFSSHRAPTTLKHLRKLDRIANWEKWPDLFYPELYLLSGGYSNFFKEKSEYCEPKAYVSMFDTNHIQTCTGEIKQHRKQSLKRSLSFSGPFGRNKLETGNYERISRSIFSISEPVEEENFIFEEEKENIQIPSVITTGCNRMTQITGTNHRNLSQHSTLQPPLMAEPLHRTARTPSPRRRLHIRSHLSASQPSFPTIHRDHNFDTDLMCINEEKNSPTL